MSIEAMKQALEALETHGTSYLNHEDSYAEAITSLRQAIAEAEKQEPACCSGKCPNKKECENAMQCLYTHPQPAPVQEPVAYRSRLASGSYTYCNTPQFFDNAEPLFTTPPAAQPKREWIGLTDEEAGKCRKGTWQATFQAIDTLLREKNGGKA